MSTLRNRPVVVDLECTRGTTRSWTFTCTLNGLAYPLSGATTTLTVKTAPLAAGAEIFSVDQTSHLDAVNGVTVLTVPASADFGTDGGTSTYVYEMRVINGSTQIVFFAGAFTVFPTGAPL